MQWGLGRGALLAALAGVLAGCTHDGRSGVAGVQPRGATVAFESIDGPPQGQFNTLVRNLNDEAQQRRLAVLSREAPSAYRVRGYLAAKVAKDRTTITWVWDVFDRDEQRTLRINGEESTKKSGKDTDAWNAADDAMLRRIASTSMEQLAVFLTSADAVPVAAAPGITPVAFIGGSDTSPEAAGIFRIFRANADPAPSQLSADAPDVPLPPQRPDSQARTVQASL
ncbi:MAG: hypothetical protein Q8M24_22575 [Pseudolabrys sp.]|nr:hypothetical protein [Pseudolabrys sp.]MDP2298239.1 hypothetical protein [Pseudolabrys sp.]